MPCNHSALSGLFHPRTASQHLELSTVSSLHQIRYHSGPGLFPRDKNCYRGFKGHVISTERRGESTPYHPWSVPLLSFSSPLVPSSSLCVAGPSKGLRAHCYATHVPPQPPNCPHWALCWLGVLLLFCYTPTPPTPLFLCILSLHPPPHPTPPPLQTVSTFRLAI